MARPRDRKAEAWAAAEAVVDRALPQLKSERPRGSDGRFVAATPPAPPATMGGIAGNLPPWLLRGKPIGLIGL